MIIDLRSDTVTDPTQEMMQAIMNAEVGDDVYKEDPTVKQIGTKTGRYVWDGCCAVFPNGKYGQPSCNKNAHPTWRTVDC